MRMLATLLRRDLRMAARDPGLRAALLVYLGALLVAAVVSYARILAGAPHPVAEGSQALSLAGTLWLLCLGIGPWALHRLGSMDRPVGLARLAAEARVRPYQVVLARAAAGYLVLLDLLVVSVPVLALEAALRGAPTTALLAPYLELLAFLLLLVAAIGHCSLVAAGELTLLALSYATLLVVVALRLGLHSYGGPASAGPAMAASAMILGLALALRANRCLLYLRE